MAITIEEAAAQGLDLSDLIPRVGLPVGGGELIEACSALDIRRWAMGVDYPNPVHWDDDFAANTKFGGLVAPQSMYVGLDVGDGMQPACAGRIPNSHVLFGGEEWWYYGHRIRPGDLLTQERSVFDYKLTETPFAGPTVFVRGDTVHKMRDGTPVAKARVTAIRYVAAEAAKRKKADGKPAETPEFSDEQLAAFAKIRRDWIMSNRDGVSPRFADVNVGDKLPQRLVGPHTIASFASEWRAFPFTTWGSSKWVGVPGMKDPWINQDGGYSMPLDYAEGMIDPRAVDGLYSGPASGHVDPKKGAEIGFNRAYGYGTTMGAWTTDYCAYWAGHDGMVRHSNVQFRSPTFEGDVTFVDGEIVSKEATSAWGVPTVTIKVKATNQDGAVLVTGTVEVEIPA